MDPQKRRFLKLMGKGFVVLGSGLVGIPLGACQRDPGYQELADLGPDLLTDARLEEMSAEEIEEFVAEVDARAAEVHGDAAGDSPAPEDSSDDTLDPEDTEGPDAQTNPVIPPGQHVVETLPSLGSNPNPRSLEEWRFYVKGEVEQALEFTWEEFNALDQVDQVIDHHCVTGWTLLNVSWAGVAVSHLLSLAQTNDNARFVVFDCENGYSTSIPIEEALKPNVLVATKLFGSPLPTEHGGLARGLVPDLYFYKSGKWVTGLRVLEQDELGFWESRGYSNSADPWNEERYGGDE